MTTDTARIYVGTYAKYNGGSIAGKWLDLEDYADKDEFLKAAAELHKDEADPEFMFQDFEGFPRALYSESYINPAIWDWLDLDEDDRELLAVYQDNIDGDADIERARENFHGKYNSKSDWAANFLEDTGSLNEVPEYLRNYIDFDAYARDADMTFIRHDGDVWVFANH
jgi:antirestriction protein